MERSPVLGPRFLGVLAVVVLFLGACTTSGGDDDAATTTTAAAEPTVTTSTGGDVTTTTEGVDRTTTTEGDEDGPTADELESLLPTAADIGPGWSEDELSDDDDDDGDDSFDEQCPEAARFGFSDEDESDDVTVAYADAETRRMEITLSPSAEAYDDEELAGFIEALNDCGTITTTDEDGTLTTLDFEATADDSYGDQGVRLQADVTLSGASLPQDITITIYGLLWREGTVGVEISAFDGIDGATFESVPIDPELLIPLADDLDPQINDLVG